MDGRTLIQTAARLTPRQMPWMPADLFSTQRTHVPPQILGAWGQPGPLYYRNFHGFGLGSENDESRQRDEYCRRRKKRRPTTRCWGKKLPDFYRNFLLKNCAFYKKCIGYKTLFGWSFSGFDPVKIRAWARDFHCLIFRIFRWTKCRFVTNLLFNINPKNPIFWKKDKKPL